MAEKCCSSKDASSQPKSSYYPRCASSIPRNLVAWMCSLRCSSNYVDKCPEESRIDEKQKMNLEGEQRHVYYCQPKCPYRSRAQILRHHRCKLLKPKKKNSKKKNISILCMPSMQNKSNILKRHENSSNRTNIGPEKNAKVTNPPVGKNGIFNNLVYSINDIELGKWQNYNNGYCRYDEPQTDDTEETYDIDCSNVNNKQCFYDRTENCKSFNCDADQKNKKGNNRQQKPNCNQVRKRKSKTMTYNNKCNHSLQRFPDNKRESTNSKRGFIVGICKEYDGDNSSQNIQLDNEHEYFSPSRAEENNLTENNQHNFCYQQRTDEPIASKCDYNFQKKKMMDPRIICFINYKSNNQENYNNQFLQEFPNELRSGKNCGYANIGAADVYKYLDQEPSTSNYQNCGRCYDQQTNTNETCSRPIKNDDQNDSILVFQQSIREEAGANCDNSNFKQKRAKNQNQFVCSDLCLASQLSCEDQELQENKNSYRDQSSRGVSNKSINKMNASGCTDKNYEFDQIDGILGCQQCICEEPSASNCKKCDFGNVKQKKAMIPKQFMCKNLCEESKHDCEDSEVIENKNINSEQTRCDASNRNISKLHDGCTGKQNICSETQDPSYRLQKDENCDFDQNDGILGCQQCICEEPSASNCKKCDFGNVKQKKAMNPKQFICKNLCQESKHVCEDSKVIENKNTNFEQTRCDASNRNISKLHGGCTGKQNINSKTQDSSYRLQENKNCDQNFGILGCQQCICEEPSASNCKKCDFGNVKQKKAMIPKPFMCKNLCQESKHDCEESEVKENKNINSEQTRCDASNRNISKLRGGCTGKKNINSKTQDSSSYRLQKDENCDFDQNGGILGCQQCICEEPSASNCKKCDFGNVKQKKAMIPKQFMCKNLCEESKHDCEDSEVIENKNINSEQTRCDASNRNISKLHDGCTGKQNICSETQDPSYRLQKDENCDFDQNDGILGCQQCICEEPSASNCKKCDFGNVKQKKAMNPKQFMCKNLCQESKHVCEDSEVIENKNTNFEQTRCDASSRNISKLHGGCTGKQNINSKTQDSSYRLQENKNCDQNDGILGCQQCICEEPSASNCKKCDFGNVKQKKAMIPKQFMCKNLCQESVNTCEDLNRYSGPNSKNQEVPTKRCSREKETKCKNEAKSFDNVESMNCGSLTSDRCLCSKSAESFECANTQENNIKSKNGKYQISRNRIQLARNCEDQFDKEYKNETCEKCNCPISNDEEDNVDTDGIYELKNTVKTSKKSIFLPNEQENINHPYDKRYLDNRDTINSEKLMYTDHLSNADNENAKQMYKRESNKRTSNLPKNVNECKNEKKNCHFVYHPSMQDNNKCSNDEGTQYNKISTSGACKYQNNVTNNMQSEQMYPSVSRYTTNDVNIQRDVSQNQAVSHPRVSRFASKSLNQYLSDNNVQENFMPEQTEQNISIYNPNSKGNLQTKGNCTLGEECFCQYCGESNQDCVNEINVENEFTTQDNPFNTNVKNVKQEMQNAQFNVEQCILCDGSNTKEKQQQNIVQPGISKHLFTDSQFTLYKTPRNVSKERSDMNSIFRSIQSKSNCDQLQNYNSNIKNSDETEQSTATENNFNQGLPLKYIPSTFPRYKMKKQAVNQFIVNDDDNDINDQVFINKNSYPSSQDNAYNENDVYNKQGIQLGVGSNGFENKKFRKYVATGKKANIVQSKLTNPSIMSKKPSTFARNGDIDNTINEEYLDEDEIDEENYDEEFMDNPDQHNGQKIKTDRSNKNINEYFPDDNRQSCKKRTIQSNASEMKDGQSIKSKRSERRNTFYNDTSSHQTIKSQMPTVKTPSQNVNKKNCFKKKKETAQSLGSCLNSQVSLSHISDRKSKKSLGPGLNIQEREPSKHPSQLSMLESEQSFSQPAKSEVSVSRSRKSLNLHEFTRPTKSQVSVKSRQTLNENKKSLAKSQVSLTNSRKKSRASLSNSKKSLNQSKMYQPASPDEKFGFADLKNTSQSVKSQIMFASKDARSKKSLNDVSRILPDDEQLNNSNLFCEQCTCSNCNKNVTAFNNDNYNPDDVRRNRSKQSKSETAQKSASKYEQSNVEGENVQNSDGDCDCELCRCPNFTETGFYDQNANISTTKKSRISVAKVPDLNISRISVAKSTQSIDYDNFQDPNKRTNTHPKNKNKHVSDNLEKTSRKNTKISDDVYIQKYGTQSEVAVIQSGENCERNIFKENDDQNNNCDECICRLNEANNRLENTDIFEENGYADDYNNINNGQSRQLVNQYNKEETLQDNRSNFEQDTESYESDSCCSQCKCLECNKNDRTQTVIAYETPLEKQKKSTQGKQSIYQPNLIKNDQSISFPKPKTQYKCNNDNTEQENTQDNNCECEKPDYPWTPCPCNDFQKNNYENQMTYPPRLSQIQTNQANLDQQSYRGSVHQSRMSVQPKMSRMQNKNKMYDQQSYYEGIQQDQMTFPPRMSQIQTNQANLDQQSYRGSVHQSRMSVQPEISQMQNKRKTLDQQSCRGSTQQDQMTFSPSMSQMQTKQADLDQKSYRDSVHQSRMSVQPEISQMQNKRKTLDQQSCRGGIQQDQMTFPPRMSQIQTNQADLDQQSYRGSVHQSRMSVQPEISQMQNKRKTLDQQSCRGGTQQDQMTFSPSMSQMQTKQADLDQKSYRDSVHQSRMSVQPKISQMQNKRKTLDQQSCRGGTQQDQMTFSPSMSQMQTKQADLDQKSYRGTVQSRISIQPKISQMQNKRKTLESCREGIPQDQVTFLSRISQIQTNQADLDQQSYRGSVYQNRMSVQPKISQMQNNSKMFDQQSFHKGIQQDQMTFQPHMSQMQTNQSDLDPKSYRGSVHQSRMSVQPEISQTHNNQRLFDQKPRCKHALQNQIEQTRQSILPDIHRSQKSNAELGKQSRGSLYQTRASNPSVKSKISKSQANLNQQIFNGNIPPSRMSVQTNQARGSTFKSAQSRASETFLDKIASCRTVKPRKLTQIISQPLISMISPPKDASESCTGHDNFNQNSVLASGVNLNKEQSYQNIRKSKSEIYGDQNISQGFSISPYEDSRNCNELDNLQKINSTPLMCLHICQISDDNDTDVDKSKTDLQNYQNKKNCSQCAKCNQYENSCSDSIQTTTDPSSCVSSNCPVILNEDDENKESCVIHDCPFKSNIECECPKPFINSCESSDHDDRPKCQTDKTKSDALVCLDISHILRDNELDRENKNVFNTRDDVCQSCSKSKDVVCDQKNKIKTNMQSPACTSFNNRKNNKTLNPGCDLKNQSMIIEQCSCLNALKDNIHLIDAIILQNVAETRSTTTMEPKTRNMDDIFCNYIFTDNINILDDNNIENVPPNKSYGYNTHIGLTESDNFNQFSQSTGIQCINEPILQNTREIQTKGSKLKPNSNYTIRERTSTQFNNNCNSTKNNNDNDETIMGMYIDCEVFSAEDVWKQWEEPISSRNDCNMDNPEERGMCAMGTQSCMAASRTKNDREIQTKHKKKCEYYKQ